MGFGDDLRHRVFGAQHVRNLRDGDQPGAFIQQSIQLLKLQGAVVVQWDHP
ncbi:hypothetical protein D3C75_1298470 [compost metagenome]